MSKIFAMVLTYNRKDLLRDCLDALCSQTRRCDQIIVIDNASTDGTFEMLTQELVDRVLVYSLPHNIGAAGGYNAGLRLAYGMGADYIWAMDDDVIPEADALDRLVRVNDMLASRNVIVPFLVSTARSTAGLLTNVPEIDKRRNAISYENWPDLLDHGIAPVTRATFVSILMPSATLKRYGLPHSSMFIWGEDSEWTLRVTRREPAYLVGGSRVVHVRQLAGILDIRTEKNSARIPYHFYLKRNDVYLKRRYEGFRAVARYIFKQVKLTARLCLGGDLAKARIVIRGTIQGLTFNPRTESADAPFDKSGIRIAEPGRRMAATPAPGDKAVAELPS